jgi:hypothetical protein
MDLTQEIPRSPPLLNKASQYLDNGIVINSKES